MCDVVLPLCRRPDPVREAMAIQHSAPRKKRAVAVQLCFVRGPPNRPAMVLLGQVLPPLKVAKSLPSQPHIGIPTALLPKAVVHGAKVQPCRRARQVHGLTQAGELSHQPGREESPRPVSLR